MDNNGIHHIVEELLARSGSSVKVVIEERFPTRRMVGGKYNPGSHTVTLYEQVIEEQCRLLFASERCLGEYIKAVFAHELGHAEDPQLTELAERLNDSPPALCKRIALQIEENAWNYAEQLVPEVDAGLMKTIIFHSLRAYRESIQEESA